MSQKRNDPKTYLEGTFLFLCVLFIEGLVYWDFGYILVGKARKQLHEPVTIVWLGIFVVGAIGCFITYLYQTAKRRRTPTTPSARDNECS